ncbi:MAG: putative Zn-dependent protease [Hyphomicrobiaceae bacterium]
MSRRDPNVLLAALLTLGLTCCAPETPARPSSHGGPESGEAHGVDTPVPPVVSHFTVRGRWPDPQQLTYRVEDRAGPIDANVFAAAVARACATWAETGLVTFVIAEADAKPDVLLGWRRGHHGACTPFSADSSVAHSGPVRRGTFVHFDAGRKWVADAEHDRDGYSVYGTALHELGHVLGLGHSTAEDAVMRTGVVRSVPLAASDLFGLQSLYGGGVDAVGDLRIESEQGELLATLRGVAASDVSDFAVFDVDGNGSDEVLVWRTDRAGYGQLMVYHFAIGSQASRAQLARTTGPFMGAMSAGASYVLLRTAADHRVLVTIFKNGKEIARQFDQHGVLRPYSMQLVDVEQLAATQVLGHLCVGDIDGDGLGECLVPVR